MHIDTSIRKRPQSLPPELNPRQSDGGAAQPPLIPTAPPMPRQFSCERFPTTPQQEHHQQNPLTLQTSSAVSTPTAVRPTMTGGVSFAVLCSIGSYLPPLAPLALVAAGPCARLSLELREKGCVLPGNLCFERRPSLSTGNTIKGGLCSSSNSSSCDLIAANAPAYLPPPQEILQHLTSHKATPLSAADRAAALLSDGKRKVTAVTVTEGTATGAAAPAAKEAMSPETVPQLGLHYALWWVQHAPVPVSLTLHRFDPEDVGQLTAHLQSLPRKVVLRELALHGQQVSDVAPFLPHCADVRALALRNTHLTSENLNLLPKSCRRVERLSLCMSSAVSGTQFLRHRALHALQDLDLSYTQVTEDDVSRDVATLRKLSRLSLEGCRKIEGLKWLQQLTRLRELDLAYSSITDSSLAALECCPELTKLDLQWCGRITSLTCLVGALCESLRELNLSETSLTNEGLAPLCNFIMLEWISLEGCGAVSDVNVLGGLAQLREVNVGRTRVTNDGAAALSQCQALRAVRMRQCYRLTDVRCLGALPLLQELDLSDCPVTNDSVAALRNARCLRKLRLQSCRAVTDVNFLSGLEQLAELDLHHTNIDEAGSVGLVHCAQLTSLILHSVRVHSLRQWNAAAFLPRLKRLDLSNTAVTSDALSFVAFCPLLETLTLRGCKSITTVDFLLLYRSPGGGRRTRCGDGNISTRNTSREVEPHVALATVTIAVAAIASAADDDTLPLLSSPPDLENRHCLVELTLSDTAVTNNGLRALKYCPGLERLRLSRCKKVTDVNVLRWLPQLKELDLSTTSVTSHGLAKLSPKGNSQVHRMTEAGAAVSAATIAITTAEEDVTSTGLGCVALEKLWLQSCQEVRNVRVLCGFPVLQELFLTGTPVPRRELDIAVLYRGNPMLQKIHHSVAITLA